MTTQPDIPTDWAEKWAIYQPEKVAFKEYETGRRLTYRTLNQRGNQLANWLTKNQGLKKGDRVAVLAENCLEYILLFVAIQKTGIILVPLNYRLSGPEIAYLIEDAFPSILIVEEQFAEKVDQKASPRYFSLESFRTEMEDRAQLAERTELNDRAQKADPETTPNADLSSRRDLDEPDASAYPSTRCDLDDPAFILYTSGSTGFPKGVQYTHGMLFWNSINTGFSITVNSDSRTVTCMPPFHTGGWNVLLTPFFHHGGFVCLMKRFDAISVVKSLQEERATIFMGVPTMLKMMAETPRFLETRFDHLLYMLVGGEAMPIPLIQRWNEVGVPIRQGYGMTECGPNLTSLHHNDAITRAGSIGRPNFFIQTRIVHPNGETCKVDEAGELWINGPIVTPGYWNNEKATAEAIQKGWFRTGDRVVEREGGYLYVVDRIKNMYISGGENVYPAEIERVLVAHPMVSEAAVIGIPDPKWGEVGKAYLVATDSASLDTENLLSYCRQNLAKFKIPKRFEIVADLPKGDTGKVDRKALAARG